MIRCPDRLSGMTAKLARHRATAAPGVPAPRPTPRTRPRSAAHRGGLPPLAGTVALAVVVAAALAVVLLGVMR